MSHSPEHNRKKAEAREEALEHLKSNVMHPRDGKDHEDHKHEMHEREERAEHGMKVRGVAY